MQGVIFWRSQSIMNGSAEQEAGKTMRRRNFNAEIRKQYGNWVNKERIIDRCLRKDH